MIIDISALIAILRYEPEAMTCARAIEAASHRRISAVNFVESAIVIDESRDRQPPFCAGRTVETSRYEERWNSE